MMVFHEKNVYTELAVHLTGNTYAWLDYLPENGILQEMLKEVFNEEEAQALLNIPVRSVPLELVSLEEIADQSSFPKEKLEKVFDSIAARGLLFSGTTAEGEKAYSLLKRGYGFSQAFYWKGDKNTQTKKMATLEKDPSLTEAWLGMRAPGENATKAWRYIPVTASIDPQWQNVYPTETIEKVIENAETIALTHCPCRVKYELIHGESCGHSTDVCIKLDELADFLIKTGLGIKISHEEALKVINKANQEGLVHFTDNTAEQIKHICNCCGCACGNLVTIKSKQIPRDKIMATYFIRITNEEECSGCGECVEVCPIDAVIIDGNVAKVDTDWCIGCGVCVLKCSSDAIKLLTREKSPLQTKNLVELYTKLDMERKSRLEKKILR